MMTNVTRGCVKTYCATPVDTRIVPYRQDFWAFAKRGNVPTSEERNPQVSQASGMVSVQADCTVEAALVLLQERARVSGQSLADVAAATVARRIRFGPTA
jgi:hypothetical protein